MPAYGLIPDSPVFYGAKKIFRGPRRAPSGGRRSPVPILRTTTTGLSFETRKVKIYNAALNIELHTSAGGLWKDLEQRSALAVAGARGMVGVRTGALKRSINSTHTANKYGQTVKIGSNLNYALLHHQGSRPHAITPKNAGGVLVFRSGSKVIKTTSVMHPGTRPNPYLSSQLRHFRY